jgi:hypothetical protein
VSLVYRTFATFAELGVLRRPQCPVLADTVEKVGVAVDAKF